MELYGFLEEWSTSMITTEGSKGYTMLISDDFRIADPCLFQLFPGFTNFCAYPKDGRPLPLAEQRDPIVLANEFVWETLLFDNYAYTGDMTVREPLYICNVCNTYYEIFDEFFTHLKSEEHRTQVRSLAASSAFTIITFCKIVMYLVCVCVCVQLFDCVPLDDHKNPKHFCQVCNYLAFDNYNLLLHTKSEEHNRKVSSIHPCLLPCNHCNHLRIPFGLFSSCRLKKRIARAGREVHNWISLARETRCNLLNEANSEHLA